MKSVRPVKVLMLGWEYPPRLAGGLGKACRGLSQGLAREGVQVLFMLPTFPERISEPHLDVVGARESMISAGWTSAMVDQGVQRQRFPEAAKKTASDGVWVMPVGAQLFPYGAHPSEPIPDRILRAFDENQENLASGSELSILQSADTKPASSSTTPAASVGLPSDPVSASVSGNKEIYGKNLWSEIERFCFAVRQLAESHEFDLVHAHDWMTFPAAFELKKATGAPVFLHVHATEYDRSGENVHSDVFRIEQEGFRQATHIFTVSRYTAGIIERLYGVQRKKISVVYNAPDDEAKQLTEVPDEDREQNVVFLGRLTFQKGPDHFLKAAALVAEVDPTARFVICGTGDMFDKLRVLAHRLGIEERVDFTGFVDPAGVEQILQRSRVLVMPSVSEPFGLVALEAIHCGIPVIMSKQSGVAEVLQRALHVDFWDHEKLADQMLAALRLRDLSRQLVSEGMEQVRGLSWDRSARKVIGVYRHQIGRVYGR